MLQLTRKGLVVYGELDALCDGFEKNHYVILEKFLEPSLLARIQSQTEQGLWHSSVFDGIGTELTLDDHAVAVRLLSFLLNTPELLNTIRIITGYVHISDFVGRVYRIFEGSQHHLSWHSDIHQQRQAGFSLNLSTDVFRGGTFEVRDRRTRAVLAQVNNAGFGDALLFRISNDLEHRVTEVVETIAKTAFAGWFRASGKSLFAELVGGSEIVPMTR
jgi:hypothetical protein